MKKIIFGIIIGIMLGSGIVYAATLYKAIDISYTPSDESWEVSNVNEALNNLYNNLTPQSQLIFLGTGRSFNIKNIVGEEYLKEYTSSDFIVVESGNSYPTFSPEFHTADQVGSINVAISWTDFSISYNQSDGAVTITGGVATATINQYWQRNGARLKTSTNNLTRTPKVYLLVKTPNANV